MSSMNPNDKSDEQYQVELSTGETLSYGLSGDVDEVFSEKDALKKLRKKARKAKVLKSKEEPTESNVVPLKVESDEEKALESQSESAIEEFILEPEPLIEETAQIAEPQKEVIDVITSSVPKPVKDVKRKEDKDDFETRTEYYQSLNYPVVSYKQMFDKLQQFFGKSSKPADDIYIKNNTAQTDY